jgi:2-(1,2-epoxy-1,2-dihydrophenyl)acetyl-CoA isomerase
MHVINEETGGVGVADAVITEVTDQVMTITLNRPEKYNAVNRDLLDGLADACARAGQPDVRAVVLTGSGRGFCAGADLTETREPVDPPSRRMRSRFAPVFMQLAALRKPVIAAVNGAVAGAGLSIAGAADIRVAADSAVFVAAFADLGVAPDTGASYFLSRAMGYSNAFAFLCGGERMDARAALARGLVNEVVPADRLLPRAADLARAMAAKPGRGVEFTKQLLQLAEGNSLAEQMEAEAQAYDITSTDEGRIAAREARARQLLKDRK